MAVQAKHRSISVISWLGWLYFGAVLGLWGVVYTLGDRWWPATLVLFGPRWLLLLPLFFLLPLAFWWPRRVLVPSVLAGVLAAGPFMGFSIPIWKRDSSRLPAIRVFSCNLQAGEYSVPALKRALQDSDADIVALQECPRELGFTIPTGWQVERDGELTLISRFPLQRGGSFQSLHPPHKWQRTCLLYCTVQAPFGNVTVCTVHLPSPRYGLQAVIDRNTGINVSRSGLLSRETAYRRDTSRKVSGIVRSLPSPVIIAGDFNMTADSTIYGETWSGYGNAFTETGFGYGWTMFTRVRGIPVGSRIDHLLAGDQLAFRDSAVWGDIGSDHHPLLADLVMR